MLDDLTLGIVANEDTVLALLCRCFLLSLLLPIPVDDFRREQLSNKYNR